MYRRFATALVAGTLFTLGTATAGEGQKHRYWDYLDADGDGQVTQEEFLRHSEEKFSKIDADGDGVITKDEMKAMHKKHKKKHQHKHKKNKE